MSIDRLTGRMALPACAAVRSRKNSSLLPNKPAVAPFLTFLATGQMRFDSVAGLGTGYVVSLSRTGQIGKGGHVRGVPFHAVVCRVDHTGCGANCRLCFDIFICFRSDNNMQAFGV